MRSTEGFKPYDWLVRSRLTSGVLASMAVLIHHTLPGHTSADPLTFTSGQVVSPQHGGRASPGLGHAWVIPRPRILFASLESADPLVELRYEP